MKKLYRAVVEGNILKLFENIGLPKGTEALITLSPIKKKKEEDTQQREIKFLEQGFDMGKLLYKKREEIYGSRG
ncbi:MAG: hypothetical protein A2W05_08650 [Candidatus Schekmanbacteria bacterium RBG_16_38_10]|uniref:DUF104 domain-containing protein n=1 Tax=Candidatus Schekmanbacteria bacterium RBG_16_38_10 TaxID=1817879 RepID=A0A1F7RUT1_9BACT|nr:MAG: hypothetical protein A2W05_08650 [Candidatus Schekmanbacteria bacterium RBG_16_38_10]